MTILPAVLDAPAQLPDGDAHFLAGAFAEASSCYHQCVRSSPGQALPSLKLAIAALALGEVGEALRSARRAVRHGPAMAEAHHVLGRALIAAGLPDQAREAFAEAARHAPADPVIWFQLGLAALEYRRNGEAIRSFRKALALDPAFASAAAKLAGCLRARSEETAAIEVLRDVIARDPDAAPVRICLIDLLLQSGQAEEALAVLDQAPPYQASGADMTLHRVSALVHLRRGEEARTALRSIAAPPPGRTLSFLWRHLQLAQSEGDKDAARDLAEQMEQALDRDGEDAEFRVAAHFHLARYWSNRDERDRHFALLSRGHKLLQRNEPFSYRRYRRFVDTTIEQFTRERMSRDRPPADADPAPVFVVGMPRSGTTLMEQILAAHGSVFGAGERRSLADLFRALGGSNDLAACATRIAGLPPETLAAETADYLAELHALAPDAARIVDKMPANFRFLGLVGLLLPGAKIIHCVRDPRDIGLSIFSIHFQGQHPYAHDLTDLGHYIGEQERLMAHWREVLPNPIMRVHLHEWIRDFDRTLRLVLDFLDLPYDAACEQFHELDREVRTASRDQVREPINDRGMSRWRDYAEHLGPLIEALQESGALAR